MLKSEAFDLTHVYVNLQWWKRGYCRLKMMSTCLTQTMQCCNKMQVTFTFMATWKMYSVIIKATYGIAKPPFPLWGYWDVL